MIFLFIGQGFADKRKRKVMNEYRKILKNERKSMQAKPPISYEEDEAESSDTQPWWVYFVKAFLNNI